VCCGVHRIQPAHVFVGATPHLAPRVSASYIVPIL